METMQTFYTQLFSAEASHSVYRTYLVTLTQLQRDQIASIKSLLWWNSWGINEA